MFLKGVFGLQNKPGISRMIYEDATAKTNSLKKGVRSKHRTPVERLAVHCLIHYLFVLLLKQSFHFGR